MGLIALMVILGMLGWDFIVNLFTRLQMDELENPTRETRLLVIAPHCDDETLGCGSLIFKTVKSGGEVKVILLTNGDGHRSAVSLSNLTIKPNAKKYFDSAYLRQKETEKAMLKAGVSQEDIVYLGYPDGGLYYMWDKNWDETNLYISPFTKYDYSPYNNSYRENAPYCGENLAGDLEDIIISFSPSIIAFPHPCDRHPDHFAAYCFIKYVITKNKLNPNQYLYLVHRGKWPSPFGQFNNLFLVPPRRLINIGTEWVSLHLSEIEQKLKISMLSEYKSQLNVNSPFLKAFIRKNELFGIYPDLEYDFNMKNGSKILLLEDPEKDKVKQNASRAADIKSLFLSTDGLNMHLYLDTVKSAAANIDYHIDMCFFPNNGERPFRINLTANKTKGISLRRDTSENIKLIDGLKLVSEQESLHVIIPYSSIPEFNSMLISASTSTASKTIDRTAWRLVKQEIIR